MQTLAVALYWLAAATWLIGGNILFIRHLRRLGKWPGVLSLLLPPAKFNEREWLALGLLTLISLSLAAAALGLSSARAI